MHQPMATDRDHDLGLGIHYGAMAGFSGRGSKREVYLFAGLGLGMILDTARWLPFSGSPGA